MSTKRTLYLLRHAKSSWADASLPDDERPLAPRGRRACAALCRHFESIELDVDLVLCSPAVRTRETWDGVRAGVRCRDVVYEPTVYGASAGELLDLVRGVNDGVGSVLLIGHNPGLGELADILAGRGELLALLHDGFPTGAFATLGFDGAWSELAERCGYLQDFVRPRDLL